MTQGIVLIAHGARDPDWATPFRALRDRIAKRTGERPVELAFLEHAMPDLQGAAQALLARGVTDILLVPMFLGRGGHLKRDVPRLVEEVTRALPGLTVTTLPAPAEDEAMLDLFTDWICGHIR
jgi:sirohydrochlorin cobaltochelatase